MPRLSALLLTLVTLSARLTLVVSADSPLVRICQERKGQPLCLTSSGPGQPVRMQNKDDSQNQLWRAYQTNLGTYTFDNVMFGCYFHKKNDQGVKPLFCEADNSDTFHPTPSVPFGSTVLFHIDLSGSSTESRLTYDSSAPGGNVTIGLRKNGSPTEFTITRVTQKASRIHVS